MLNKKSHKEELNLNFVPAIRTTHTGYDNITQEKNLHKEKRTFIYNLPFNKFFFVFLFFYFLFVFLFFLFFS